MRDRPESFEDLPILAELREQLASHFLAHGPGQDSRRVSSRRRRSRPLLAFALLLVAAGTAAAAVSLSGQPSQPLSGSVPSGHARPSPRSEAGKLYHITFVPQLSGGQADWTTFIGFQAHGAPPRGGDGGDAGYPTSAMPLVGGSGVGFTSFPTGGGQIVDYVLTGPQVAAVRVGRQTIKTTTSAELPERDHVAVFFRAASSPPVVIPPVGARLPYRERIPVYRKTRTHHGRIARPIVQSVPHTTKLIATTALQPLDGDGQVIPLSNASPLALSPSIRAWQISVPGQRHPAAAADHPLPGACELSAHGLPGLQPEWGHVVAAIQPVSDAEGELFLSCVDTEYFLHGWAFDAAILLDAHAPGRVLGRIPGAVPVPGHPGVLNDAFNGATPRGDLSARRVGNAWLVVQGGRGVAQRLEVLRALAISKLSLRGVSMPASERLAGRARTCLLGRGYQVKASSSPNANQAYGLSIAGPHGDGALAEIYDSRREARLALPAAIDSLRRTRAAVRVSGQATVISFPRSSRALLDALEGCLADR